MTTTDRYNRWLRQDIPRLLITAVIVVISIWGLWLVQERWNIFSWIIPAPTQLREQQLQADTTEVPAVLPSNDQTVEEE